MREFFCQVHTKFALASSHTLGKLSPSSREM
jgi:hypothetical protein